MNVQLDGSSLTLNALVAIADGDATVSLSPDTRARVSRSRAVVERKAAGGQPVYGVNTGFGSLSDIAIASDQLQQLQVNLIRSHAAGVGDPLPVRTVRAMMALRANVLAKGFSGIRLESLERLLDLINCRVHPRIPRFGSVGASGDLAPLAHLAMVLIGEGEVLVDGPPGTTLARRPAIEALREAAVEPVVLEPKEGLALINGTQASTASLALALWDADRVAVAADIVAALSIDALQGSAHPFESRIHEARGFHGQSTSAANIASLLARSMLNRSHEHCGQVQDAYSLRCAAQVHGAARDVLDFVRRTVEVESNAATDNPMVFIEADEMISGGNFHGAPVGMAADLLALAMVQFATISERRIERLVNPALSGLSPFLARQSGLQSGLMLAHVTAAALTAEARRFAHPCSVDTIPTSAAKEDHVSMSMSAALKAVTSVTMVRGVIATECLCACQALDLRAPLTSSAPLMRMHARVRRDIPTLVDDRPPGPDIEQLALLIDQGVLQSSCDVPLG